MYLVAVIDIGKTNAKLAIVDADLRQEVDVTTTPNKVVDSAPYPHFDIDNLWTFIVESLEKFAATYVIEAITVTTHGACVALLDESGHLATPILDYESKAPDLYRDEYHATRPAFEATGSPHAAGGLNVGAQLYWLFKSQPQLHSRTKTIVMYPQYWVHRLCGKAANEPTSLGAHTDLWNPTEATFSTLVDSMAIREKMARVELPSTELGTLLPEIATTTGLRQDTMVYCGIHDSNASLYPHLLDRNGPFSVVSTGTWIICLSPGSNPAKLDPARDTLLNVNALGKATPSSRFMGGREYDYLTKTYATQTTKKLSQKVIDSNAFILPAVETSTGPFQNSPYLWTVEPDSLTAAERYNVVSFYLAMMTATCLELCPASGSIIVEGPFTNNKLFCTLLQAATDRQVLGLDNSSSTGTTIGAALTTRKSGREKKRFGKENAGSYQNLAQAVDTGIFSDYISAWKEAAISHTAAD